MPSFCRGWSSSATWSLTAPCSKSSGPSPTQRDCKLIELGLLNKLALISWISYRFRYHQDQNGKLSGTLLNIDHTFSSYRTAMRSYWARDDPAFLLILLTIMTGTKNIYLCVLKFIDCLVSLVSVIGYGLWLRLHVLGFFLALLWTVLSDCLLAGAIIATLFW